MERLYIYSSAMAVIGLCLFVPAAQSVVTGDQSISILLMTVGGGGMISGAVYKSIRTDPEEFEFHSVRLLLLVVLACLAVLGTALSLV